MESCVKFKVKIAVVRKRKGDGDRNREKVVVEGGWGEKGGEKGKDMRSKRGEVESMKHKKFFFGTSRYLLLLRTLPIISSCDY